MWTYDYQDTNELFHHGVKGMKWGKRRYQNPDGSLTSRGKKRISKKYEKTSNAVVSDLNKSYNKIYADSYNKMANKMNNGGIEKFNSQQKKKYGDNYSRRDGYVDDYNKIVEKELAKAWNKTLSDFYSSNKNFKKASELVDKYGMEQWDDLARSNSEIIRDLKAHVK